MGKTWFSWRLQNSQQPAPSISMLRCVWEIHKDYFICTPVLLFSSGLPHPSFLLIFYMVGLLSLVMLGCVGRGHLRQRRREKLCRKCEQDEVCEDGRAESTQMCEAGRFLHVHSDWLLSEWTFVRNVTEKAEPNSSQRCTVGGQELVSTACSKGVYDWM